MQTLEAAVLAAAEEAGCGPNVSLVTPQFYLLDEESSPYWLNGPRQPISSAKSVSCS
jgi:hypothetical protein